MRLWDLSAQVVRDIIDETRDLPADSAVVIVDDSGDEDERLGHLRDVAE